MINLNTKFYCSCGVLAFSVILSSGNVWAADPGCIQGNCDGYTKSAADCTGKSAIKCPFDTSKYYCQDSINNCQAGTFLNNGNCEVCSGNTYSEARAESCTACPEGTNVNSDHTGCVCKGSFKFPCSGTGYASGNGIVCNGKYESCTCSADYRWDGLSCKSDTCGAHGYLSTRPDSSKIGTGCNYKDYNSCTTVSIANRTDNKSEICYNCTSNPYGSGRGVLRTCNGTQYCCGSGGNSMECSNVIIGIGGCIKY